MGTLILCLSAAILIAAAASGGFGWLLVWPAVSFAIVGASYASSRPEVFGKQPDGGLRASRVALLLPYLLATWLTWHFARAVDRSAGWARLTDTLYIGRRPLGSDLPGGIRSVVDLTCEFAERPEVTGKHRYLCVPMLDASPVAADRLERLAAEIAALPPPVYLHCAQGHGRTAMVAATFLIVSGQSSSVEQALAEIRKVRPRARPNRSQVRALHAVVGRRAVG